MSSRLLQSQLRSSLVEDKPAVREEKEGRKGGKGGKIEKKVYTKEDRRIAKKRKKLVAAKLVSKKKKLEEEKAKKGEKVTNVLAMLSKLDGKTKDMRVKEVSQGKVKAIHEHSIDKYEDWLDEFL
mmetsp:Transcript_21297/g.55383  ORF Transcript_21297/g.55383 Transcript_21297/m.55383 type:complete len:125 (-) Transcript_21297:2653-3027(-)